MIVEERSSQRALAIVERYEQAVNYLYPMLLNMSHKHRVLRDETLRALIAQISLFHDAAKASPADHNVVSSPLPASANTLRGLENGE